MRHPVTMLPPRVPGGRPRLLYPWPAIRIGDDFLVPKEWFAHRTMDRMQKYLSSYANTLNGSYATRRTQLGLVVKRVRVTSPAPFKHGSLPSTERDPERDPTGFGAQARWFRRVLLGLPE